VQPVTVALDDPAEPGLRVAGLAYTDVVGVPEIGDRVLLNTTAIALGLGTGGSAMVVAIPDRLPADDPARPPLAPGHVVKARYTPLQTTVLGVDEQDSPHHAALREADDLGGMPVVMADLHSALPAVLAGLRSAVGGSDRAAAAGPPPRVAYVMSDGGALPLPFSRTVAMLREAGWLVGSVTVGQAYGGDLEATTLHTGLLAARLVLDADVAVVTQGPGNLGTGTRWGFSGVAVGEAVNAAGVLGGRPVAVLRVSEADPRPRHRGVSHHSLTALGRVALQPCDVVLPVLPDPFGTQLRDQVAPLARRHRIVPVDVDGLLPVLRTVPVGLRTMGRGLDEDAASFLAAAAAGRHVLAMLRS
jgi:hypothetical protein